MSYFESFAEGTQAPFLPLRKGIWWWPPSPDVLVSVSSAASISIIVGRIALATIEVRMMFWPLGITVPSHILSRREARRHGLPVPDDFASIPTLAWAPCPPIASVAVEIPVSSPVHRTSR